MGPDYLRLVAELAHKCQINNTASDLLNKMIEDCMFDEMHKKGYTTANIKDLIGKKIALSPMDKINYLLEHGYDIYRDIYEGLNN